MKIRFVTVVLLFLAAFSLRLTPAIALDLQARVDTRYQLQAGDRAVDNDLYQYHYLELPFLKFFTFSWNGGVRKDLDGTINELSAANVEKTDIALRGLADAVNTDQSLEYRIYSAYVKFDLGRFGALLGRYTPYDYELAQYDGLLLWASPLDWLRIEAFGGKPWHYGYIGDFRYYWDAAELVVGAGMDLAFRDDSLRLALRYLFLREQTRLDALIGETPGIYLSSDHLSKARVTWDAAPWLQAGAAGSFLNLSPRGLQAWVSGSVDSLLISYSLNYGMQFIDIADLSDRLTQFSSFLTASHPYLSLSAEVTKNFSDLVSFKGFFTDLELELAYEHRQPLEKADRSMFNPQYDQFRVGTLLAARGGWSMLLFYNFVLSTGLQNDLHAVGGELAKKWERIDARLGSAYYANRFETDYTETLVRDSFFAQEYYLKVKWRISRAFDLSLKGAYERALVSSLTSTEKINELVISAPMTELSSEPRNYFRFDLRAGYRY